MMQKKFLNTNIKLSHSRTLLSGIFNACSYQIRKTLLNKQPLRGRSPITTLGDDGLYVYNSNGSRMEDPGQKPSGMTQWNEQQTARGFTLIELLVVVLIIGILAAVALPQYQMAVMKARFTQAILLMDSVWKAQQVYRMTNGKYGKLEDLDVSLPEPLSESTEKIWQYPWGSCYNDTTAYYEGYCRTKDELYYFRQYNTNVKQCRVYTDKKNSALATKICLSLGGTNKQANTGYDIYTLP